MSLATAARANVPAVATAPPPSPVDAIAFAGLGTANASTLEQIVWSDPATAFSGRACEQLEPLAAAAREQHVHALLAGYLRVVCAKSELDLDRLKKEMFVAIAAARISPHAFFGEELLRADGMLDAIALVRFRNVPYVGSHFEIGGGGKRIYYVVIVKADKDMPQRVWRFDLSAYAQNMVQAAAGRIRDAGQDAQLAEDLAGLTYLMAHSEQADPAASALIGKAAFLAGLPGKSLADEDVKTLLERAAHDENNAYANWLLAYALLHDPKTPDAALAVRAVTLARMSADAGLAEAGALLAALSETGLGTRKDPGARDLALRQVGTEVGQAHAQFLLASALQALPGRPQAYAAGTRWLEKAANAGDADAQNDFAAQCEGTRVERSAARNCRIRWYEKSAAQGNPRAMFNLGIEFSQGRHVEQDFALALQWYSRALALDDVDAGASLGVMYQQGQGVPPDVAKAAVVYREAAAQGSAWGENNLGVLLRSGEGVAKDTAQALRWTHLAALQANPNGMYGWAQALENGDGVEIDHKAAFEFYLASATFGYVKAMDRVAFLYEYGTGTAINHGQAAAWYDRAARLGNVDAMNRLGWLLFDGNGVQKDQAAAVDLYRRSAATGDAEGMRGLGYALVYRDVGSDFSQGLPWFEKSAAAGSASAMNNLAWVYRNGKHVPADLPLSNRWLEKAATAGDLDSMNTLGLAYEEGAGSEKDPVKAVAWFARAAEGENIDGLINYARHLGAGDGVATDPVKAQKYLETAAARGSAVAKCNLGLLIHEDSDAGPQEARAWALVTEAADAGNSACQIAAGLSLMHGGFTVLKPDFARARHYLELASAQDNAEAQAALAALILQTQENDTIQSAGARKRLEKLAANGQLRARFYLAEEYFFGRGGDVDLPAARVAFEQLAAQDNQYTSITADVAGDMLVAGQGGPKDLSGAERWYRRAVAAGGNKGSVYHLGNLQLHLSRSKEALTMLEKSAADDYLAAQYRVVRFCRESASCPVSAKLRSQYAERIAGLSVYQKNNLAWAIAIDPLSDQEDGRFCASLIEPLLQEKPEPFYVVDTLAACMARAGDFDQAAATQHRYLQLLTGDIKQSFRRDAEKRLAAYQDHLLWNGPN